MFFFFFQAEDGIRDLVRSRGLGDVYKRQGYDNPKPLGSSNAETGGGLSLPIWISYMQQALKGCLLYTSDAADERSSVDLGGRRIIKKKNKRTQSERQAKQLKK